MTLLRKDSILSVLVVGILLVGSTFAFLPAFAASSASASTNGAAPTALAGVTTSIDYPVIVGTLGTTTASRTVSISNPLGNAAITDVTVVIPKGAVSNAETASQVASLSSCNPAQASPNLPCTATAIGSGTGPYTVNYAVSSGSLIPGGATVALTFGFAMESTQTSSSAADSYTIQMSATDSSGANTILPSVTLYESATPTIAFGTLSTPPTLCSPAQCAGTPFTVPVTSTVNGLALAVVGSVVTSNAAPVLTISPGTNGTFTSSSSQTVTVNETGAGTLTLNVTGAGSLSSYSSGGAIPVSQATVNIAAGAVTKLSIVITSAGGTAAIGQIYNVTQADWATGPIPGSGISISTSDAFGNPAVFSTTSSTTVTVAANTLSGQPAGFSTGTAYGATYPFAPTAGLGASASVTIAANSATANLGTSNLFYGVDYGSQAQLTASATGTTLSTGTSAIIQTYTLDTNPVTLTPSTTSPKGGSSVTLTAVLPLAQAHVPVWLQNTTNTWSLPASYFEAFTSVNSTGFAIATYTLTSPTTSGLTETFEAYQVFATPASPIVLANNTANPSAPVSITTIAGNIAKLSVYAFFPTTVSPTTQIEYEYGASTTNFIYESTGGTATPTSVSIASQGLGIDVVPTDANGNPVPVIGSVQVTLAATGGSLSLTTAFMNQFASCTTTSGVVQYGCDTGWVTAITYTTPSTTGTVTITATAAGATGSTTIKVVSPTPMLTVVPPTTFTSGIVSTFSGVANASAGIMGNYISQITVSINGGTATNAVLGTAGAANTTWSFATLLTGTSSLNFTVYDSQSPANTFSVIVQVPPVPPSSSFTFPAAPAQISLSAAYPVAINATIVNAQAVSITAVVVAVVSNSAGQQGIFTGTVLVAAGATASAFPIISGLAAGTYSVQVFVLSTSGGTLSSSTTTTVTVS